MTERQRRNSVDLWLAGGFAVASVVAVVSFTSLLLAGTEQASAYWGLVFGLPIIVVALSLGWAVVSTSRASARAVLPPLWFEAGGEAAPQGEVSVGGPGEATPARGYAAAPR